jgi:hypothetical protein
MNYTQVMKHGMQPATDVELGVQGAGYQILLVHQLKALDLDIALLPQGSCSPCVLRSKSADLGRLPKICDVQR